MTTLRQCIIPMNCNKDLANQCAVLISIGWKTCLLLTVKLLIMLEDVSVAKHCIYMYTCMQRHGIPSGGPDGGDGVGAMGAL